MGRTLVVQAFWLACFCLCLSGPVSPAARAAGTDILPVPNIVVVIDPLDDLVSWLQQVCAVVQCSLERTAIESTSMQANRSGAALVISYECYGVREDLTPDQFEYARFAASRASLALKVNAGRLDPEVEAALFDTLNAIQSDLDE
ncbi:MAG: hypothetical protein ACREJD_01845 [Phycisphaerales bacterium]